LTGRHPIKGITCLSIGFAQIFEQIYDFRPLMFDFSMGNSFDLTEKTTTYRKHGPSSQYRQLGNFLIQKSKQFMRFISAFK